jgi:hypothetical protein
MSQCRLSRAYLTRLPTEGVCSGRLRPRPLDNAWCASVVLAPVVGCMPSSSTGVPHCGGCGVLRAGGEAHLGGVRCNRCGSGAWRKASPLAEVWHLASKSGGSWTALVAGHGWWCMEEGGRGGCRHCLGELSVSGCRSRLVVAVVTCSLWMGSCSTPAAVWCFPWWWWSCPPPPPPPFLSSVGPVKAVFVSFVWAPFPLCWVIFVGACASC